MLKKTIGCMKCILKDDCDDIFVSMWLCPVSKEIVWRSSGISARTDSIIPATYKYEKCPYNAERVKLLEQHIDNLHTIIESYEAQFGVRYWKICSHGYSIGVCTDRESVLQENPDATFEEITEEEYERFKEDE